MIVVVVDCDRLGTGDSWEMQYDWTVGRRSTTGESAEIETCSFVRHEADVPMLKPRSRH